MQQHCVDAFRHLRGDHSDDFRQRVRRKVEIRHFLPSAGRPASMVKNRPASRATTTAARNVRTWLDSARHASDFTHRRRELGLAAVPGTQTGPERAGPPAASLGGTGSADSMPHRSTLAMADAYAEC